MRQAGRGALEGGEEETRLENGEKQGAGGSGEGESILLLRDKGPAAGAAWGRARGEGVKGERAQDSRRQGRGCRGVAGRQGPSRWEGRQLSQPGPVVWWRQRQRGGWARAAQRAAWPWHWQRPLTPAAASPARTPNSTRRWLATTLALEPGGARKVTFSGPPKAPGQAGLRHSDLQGPLVAQAADRTRAGGPGVQKRRLTDVRRKGPPRARVRLPLQVAPADKAQAWGQEATMPASWVTGGRQKRGRPPGW